VLKPAGGARATLRQRARQQRPGDPARRRPAGRRCQPCGPRL